MARTRTAPTTGHDFTPVDGKLLEVDDLHVEFVTDDGVEVLTGGPGSVSPCAPWNR